MQQKEIKLYERSVPGSENWNWTEDKNDRNRANIMTVYNVVDPTLSVFYLTPQLQLELQ
ncbi:hypothetical protein [Xanthocytophaga agilis]|uniref:Uncharacterized protein n=1 Tax=Xanthocytophaga agilis TaxID=3048010 RepID=A0AAE3QX16_9BACT|nr:hypothetical protein [Xanthocytophaga agilis]MDJ1499616.1 hypothetical protein [Xanthocytophaga agilis]